MYNYFLLVIFFTHIIVDVICVSHQTYRQASTKYEQNISSETKVSRRSPTNLQNLFKQLKDDIIHERIKRPVFYKNCPPTLRGNVVHYRFLDQGFYATLYDTINKTPVYSAYTLHFDHNRISGRIYGWFQHPLLEVEEQPRIEDFIGIGRKDLRYHRGHLYPQFYAAETIEMKRMTNLITNVAIQHGAFNINTWKRLEYSLFSETRNECNNAGGYSYFLTGVIPSRRNFFHNINIPKYFWTAVCCDMSIAHKHEYFDWSFAYIVENEAKRSQNIDMYSVKDFRNMWLYQFGSLFRPSTHNECSSDPEISIGVINKIINRNNKDRFFMRGELFRFSNRPRGRSRTVDLKP